MICRQRLGMSAHFWLWIKLSSPFSTKGQKARGFLHVQCSHTSLVELFRLKKIFLFYLTFSPICFSFPSSYFFSGFHSTPFLFLSHFSFSLQKFFHLPFLPRPSLSFIFSIISIAQEHSEWHAISVSFYYKYHDYLVLFRNPKIMHSNSVGIQIFGTYNIGFLHFIWTIFAFWYRFRFW